MLNFSLKKQLKLGKEKKEAKSEKEEEKSRDNDNTTKLRKEGFSNGGVVKMGETGGKVDNPFYHQQEMMATYFQNNAKNDNIPINDDNYYPTEIGRASCRERV